MLNYRVLFYHHMRKLQVLDAGRPISLTETKHRRILHLLFFVRSVILDEEELDYEEPLQWNYSKEPMSSLAAAMESLLLPQISEYDNENSILRKLDDILRPKKSLQNGDKPEDVVIEELTNQLTYDRARRRLKRLRVLTAKRPPTYE